MNKYITFTLVVYALLADSYGGYGSSAASTHNFNSYSLGAGNAASPYAGPAYALPSYTPPAYRVYSDPKQALQALYAHEIYPGQQNYKSYHFAPTYSQVALPIVPSAPVAKLYVPAERYYRAY